MIVVVNARLLSGEVTKESGTTITTTREITANIMNVMKGEMAMAMVDGNISASGNHGLYRGLCGFRIADCADLSGFHGL